MTRDPRDKELAPDDLFDSEALAEFKVRLKHFEMCGIGLVTGESGVGKTTARRQLVPTLNTGLYRVIYVSLTTSNVMDL